MAKTRPEDLDPGEIHKHSSYKTLQLRYPGLRVLIACGVRGACYQDSVDDIFALVFGSIFLGKRDFAQSAQRGKDTADDIVGGCVYFRDWGCASGESRSGGLEESAELGAVEAAGSVDFGDGDVGVKDCDVHFSFFKGPDILMIL